MIERIKFLGTLADMAYNTKGNIPAVQGMFPTVRGGLHSGPNIDTVQVATYTSYPTGAATLRDQNRNYKTYVGTATKIFSEDDNFAIYSDVSRTVGGVYSSSPSNPWTFTQFGNISLAANKTNELQSRVLNSATAFANVAGAPKAAIIVTVGPPSSPVIMCFNYNDGTDVPDGWYASGLSDYTGWTVGVNESAKGQIIDITGPFVAAIPYRDGVIAFKEDGMWEGTYVGSPIIWAWRRIASQVGCIGPNALCLVDDTIFFAAKTGLYRYDGSYPQKIPGSIHGWWSSNVADSFWPDRWNDYFNHAHFVKHVPEASCICFGLANNDVQSLTTPAMVNLVVWLNLISGMWILDDKWGNGVYPYLMNNFVDSTKVLLHTAASTWKSHRMNFGFADSGSFTPAIHLSFSGIGAGEPGMTELRSIKPVYEQAWDKNGDVLGGSVLMGASSEEWFLQGPYQTATATRQVNNGWADYSDKQISGNFIDGAIDWVPAVNNYYTIEVTGLLVDTVPVGKDHG